MTREEENRRLAEWLEAKPTGEPWTIPLRSPKGGWKNSIPAICDGRHIYHWVPCDFYRDEAANPLLLEKMVFDYKIVRLTLRNGLTSIIVGSEAAPDVTYEHSQFKTAIIQAALKLIEREGHGG